MPVYRKQASVVRHLSVLLIMLCTAGSLVSFLVYAALLWLDVDTHYWRIAGTVFAIISLATVFSIIFARVTTVFLCSLQQVP